MSIKFYLSPARNGGALLEIEFEARAGTLAPARVGHTCANKQLFEKHRWHNRHIKPMLKKLTIHRDSYESQLYI